MREVWLCHHVPVGPGRPSREPGGSVHQPRPGGHAQPSPDSNASPRSRGARSCRLRAHGSPVDACMAGPFSRGWGPPVWSCASPAGVPVLEADHKHVQNALLVLQCVKPADVSVCPRITLRASRGPPRSYTLTAVVLHRGSANSGYFVVSHFFASRSPICGCFCWGSGCWSPGIAQRVLGSCVAHKAAADVSEAAAGCLRTHVTCWPGIATACYMQAALERVSHASHGSLQLVALLKERRHQYQATMHDLACACSMPVCSIVRVSHLQAYVLHGKPPQPRRWWLCNDSCVQPQPPGFCPSQCMVARHQACFLTYQAATRKGSPPLAAAPVGSSRSVAGCTTERQNFQQGPDQNQCMPCWVMPP